MKKFYLLFGLVGGFLGSFATSAAADSYCVSCKGPDHLYLCEVSSGVQSVGRQAAQLFCVVKISKKYGHQSCSVKNMRGLPCPGTLASLIYTGPVIGPSSPVQGGNSVSENPLPPDLPPDLAPNQAEGTRQAKPPQKEPETLVDFTNETVKQTGENLKNAGKAVGSATKKVGEAVGDATKKTGEFVKDTAISTGNKVKDTAVNTGEGIGNAAKKAYKCITSLFGNC